MRCDGFAKAMEAIGWLSLDDHNEQISIPGFDLHHGKSAKKRLLTARRVAKLRLLSNAESNAKSNAGGVTDALPTEQNRRLKTTTPLALPDWMPPEWHDFDEMRRSKSAKAWTRRAQELAIQELTKPRNAGHDATPVCFRLGQARLCRSPPPNGWPYEGPDP